MLSKVSKGTCVCSVQKKDKECERSVVVDKKIRDGGGKSGCQTIEQGAPEDDALYKLGRGSQEQGVDHLARVPLRLSIPIPRRHITSTAKLPIASAPYPQAASLDRCAHKPASCSRGSKGRDASL